VKYLSGGLPRGAEENYKKTSVRMAVNEPTFEPETPPQHYAGRLTTCPHSIQCHLFIIIFILANRRKNLLFKAKVHNCSMQKPSYELGPCCASAFILDQK